VGAGEGGLTVEAATPEPAVAPRRRRRLRLTTPALLGLPVSWLAVFFLAPIAIVAAYSVDVLVLAPQPEGFTLSAWRSLFSSGNPYLHLFAKSVEMSLIVSTVVVLVAYPLAYFLALSGTKRKYILLLILIAPFLTSYLLRVLAWKVILGDQGVINTFLFWMGRSQDHPLSFLLYSRFAVMLVLGYVWLPFVALPIFVTLETLDRGLLEAASDLYASRLQAFVRVTLPLSAPGLVAAFLFVFIPTVGEFITPSLVGGTGGYMYGIQMVDLFGTGFPDWETGSVLALFLLAVIAVLTLVFVRFLRTGEAPAT
jgi:spermidine/putrescine transport system permease protein